MVKITRLIFLLLLPLTTNAQSVDMNRLVSFRFQNERLGYILSEVSRKYGVPFSYSSSFIPVDKRITINERKVPLGKGLNKLFASTKIVYALIGNNIVLKIDESKEVTPIIEPAIERKRNIEMEELSFLKRYSFPILVWEHLIAPEILEQMKSISPNKPQIEVSEKVSEFSKKELFQVTLIPPISTNEENADKITNTFSFNVLWGKNGGLDGIEVGGFVNTIVNNMSGFQLAGVGNRVGGDAQGTQFAAIFNHNEGFSKGLQFSGFFNIANAANAIQIAGLANIVQEGFKGVQIALFGNYVRTKVNGVQAAGLFNYTKGQANVQIALGINKANEISKIQIGLVNIANYTKGKQIGIVNIANQSESTPIGLLSFAKNGYNKIELSAGEALYANVGFKFGVRKLYNIFQFGTRFTDDIWSLGYGIGTAFQLKERQYFHLEYVVSHVNENDVWIKELNLLNQFKFNFDWQLKSQGSLFLGPSWNFMVSKIKNLETQEIIGSNLPTYTILNTTRKNTNWKMWFGVNGGIRF